MITQKGEVRMRKCIMKKLILMTTLLLLGTTATQTSNSPLNVSTDAKAYHIGQDETNINELIKYYTHNCLSHFQIDGYTNMMTATFMLNLSVILGQRIYDYGVLKVGATLIN